MRIAAYTGSALFALLLAATRSPAEAPSTAAPGEPPAVSYAALHFDSDANVDLVVTDPHGRRTGRDPVSGVEFHEIPMSSYRTDEIGDDEEPTGLPTPAEKVLEITDPVSGGFGVDVIGMQKGPYTLEVDAFDLAGKHSHAALTGMASKGSRSRYRVTYSASPGDAVRLAPALSR